MINNGMMTSKTSEWATPQWLFNEMNDACQFDVDVCATHENAKCEKYWTKEDDGLSKDWKGTVWCNPPYGREIGLWVKKAYEECNKHDNLIVMLLPARTDTKWFHDYILETDQDVSFIKGRLKFNDGKNSAPFPSMIVAFMSNKRRAKVRGNHTPKKSHDPYANLEPWNSWHESQL